MDGLCLTCGTWADLEAHHVAGRHNHPLVVPVCVPCHSILSSWQRAAGIELDRDAPRTEEDRTRALVVGAAHLLQLFAQRHQDRSWISAELWIHTIRAGSRLLDACAPPGRPGRWLPDPTVVPAEATPAQWHETAELERTAEFANLVLALARVLGDHPPLTLEVLAGIASSPAPFVEAIAQSAEDSQIAQQTLNLVNEYLLASARFVRQLLTLNLDDPDAIDHALLEEAATWFSVGHRLLQQLLDIAFSRTNGATP